ncbi:MAG: efflux RND transporter permease subunit [Candidatus Omnitrophica bacterium]|nr:efflux RND transporter permease subunit [Candidatus Omnitrophota bacterium]
MLLPEVSIRRPVLATVMSLGLILFGAVGLSRLPVRELPDVDPPIVTVTTVYPGSSAAVIEAQVTERLEEALTSIEGIKTLSSESREQVSNITVEFDLSRDVDLAAQDVRDRVSRVRGRLPEDVEEPVVAKQDADARPSMWIALFSDRFSTLELTSIAENQIKDRLQTVPGVSSILLGGSKRFAIRLWLDSEKMAARGVTVLDVQNALRQQSVELPSGRIENRQRELSIEMRGQMKTPEEYDNLVIKRDGSTLVTLKDIGRAAVGVEDEHSEARFNSRPAVGVGVIKQSKANAVAVAKAVKKELQRIKPLLPEGIETSIPYDESVYVEKAISEVWETLWMSFVLVVISIYVFLYNFRATLVPSITIPVSVVATFGVLYFFGYSINIITMLSLVLALGEVVDDTIVVVENIHRHIDEGMPPFEAARKGMREITFAVIATTLALVAIFLPMAFQTTTTGRLFVEFAVTISVSVLVSAFVSLTLSPMICARALRPNPGHVGSGLIAHFERWLTNMTARYDKWLRWSLNHSGLMMLIGTLTFVLSVFLYTRLDKEFLPDEDKGRLFCIAIAPEGATSEYTSRMVRKMEGFIRETPEVDGYFSAVALARGSVGRANEGLAFIRLKEERDRSVQDIIAGPNGLGSKFFNDIEGAIAIPIVPKAIGFGFGQNFQLVLQHQDLKTLNEISQKIANKLRATGTLMNVRPTFQLDKPELRVQIDRARAASLGVSIEDVSRTLQILFGGLDLAKINLQGKEYDVIVQLEREARLTPSDLEKLYARNAAGDLIQLSSITTYTIGAGPSAINHYNRFRSSTIEATPVGAAIGTVMDQTEKMLKKELPEGARFEWAGEARNVREASRDTVFVLTLAIMIIYLVLAAQFESWSHPLTVMLTIPLGAIGAFGLLWLMAQVNIFGTMLYGWAHYAPDPPAVAKALSAIVPRIPSMGINLFSQIGILLLLGLITKNGILLVDFANQEMANGKSAQEAMISAGRIRLRPILMTAFSTFAGTLPVAIGFGAGAESRRPLGMVVVGGMLTSTFLTLFIIPVMYVTFSRLFGRLRGRKLELPRATAGTAVLLLLPFLTAGCAVGPNYRRPEIAMPAEWKTPPSAVQWKEAAPRDQEPRGPWWEIFGDHQLNLLEMQAVEANQDLKAAVARVTQARALARVSQSGFVPNVTAGASYERFRRSLSGFGSGNRVIQNQNYKIPLDLSYEIDLWGKVRRSFEAARAEAIAAEEAYHSILLILTTDVALNYFTLQALDSERAILLKTVGLRREALEVMRERMEGGIGDNLDVARAETELSTAEAEVIDLSRRRAELENALALLCGQPASGFKLALMPLAADPPSIPAGLPSSLLERRPDIAEAERRMAAANAKIGVAQAAFFPTITLTASGGFDTPSSKDVLTWDSRVWSIGPGVSFPLTAVGRNMANFRAIRSGYEETLAAYKQKVLTAIRETEDALVNLRLRREQAEAQDRVVEAARRAASLSNERYAQGLVNYLEVIDARRACLEAERAAVQIRNQQMASTILLVKALGGGWGSTDRKAHQPIRFSRDSREMAGSDSTPSP